MKRLFLLPLLILLLACAYPALSEEAADITAQCKFTASPGKYKVTRAYDRDYIKAYISDKVRNPYVQITAPKNQEIYSLYICFGHKPITAWEVQASRNGAWETIYENEGRYAHEYVVFDQGETALRVVSRAEKATTFIVSELFAFGPGEAPDYVQIWEPTPEKADLMVISAHPDDEILFFGGTIPTYAAERGLNVVVVYMTNGGASTGVASRRSELLNGLWEMGMRQYPVIGEWEDKYCLKLETGYKYWGKTETWAYITNLFRQYQPEVVVTHDVNGEYGHGQHRVCADAALRCVETAADPASFPESAEQWGVWQVKKLYLHLYPENQIEMDWDQPLAALNGRTGYEAAKDAFPLHVSQYGSGQKNPDTGKYEVFKVETRKSKYSCYRFGLAYTAVGPDAAKNDFMENITGF